MATREVAAKDRIGLSGSRPPCVPDTPACSERGALALSPADRSMSRCCVGCNGAVVAVSDPTFDAYVQVWKTFAAYSRCHTETTRCKGPEKTEAYRAMLKATKELRKAVRDAKQILLQSIANMEKE